MRQSIPILLLAALLGLSTSACPSEGTDASSATDALPGTDAGSGTDAGGGTDAASSTDAGGGTDAAIAYDHFGLVWVGDTYGGVLAGSVYAGFVSAGDLGLTGSGRSHIAGAPDCFQELPPPPAVPNWLAAGTLAFTGLAVDPFSLGASMGNEYDPYNGAAILGTPGSTISLDVPGGAIINGWSGATVVTPDPPAGLSFTVAGSGDLDINWTPGNGDRVLLRVSTSSGTNACEVPDNGTFSMPAVVYAPDPGPLGGVITFRREIETRHSSFGVQELRFVAFVQDQIL